MAALGCAGTPPERPAGDAAELLPCPPRPNCVSTRSDDAARRIEPFELAVAAAQAWPVIRQAVADLRGTTLVRASATGLRAECRSALFRFVDDLELRLDADGRRVAIRSAARLGYSDFGVNRRRVERLRAALRGRGLIR
jgi:uncharacterized protein (DUF1499 family)